MPDSRIRHVLVAAADVHCPRNDTASVLELPSGELLVVWHRYEQSPEQGSDFGICRIYAQRSADGGLTWRDSRMVVDRLPGDLNAQAPALCRLPGGDLLLICLHAHRNNSSSLGLYRSRDDGRTFAFERFLWERSQGQWLQGGASLLLRLACGRLLVPFHGGSGDQGGQHNAVGVVFSDDDGLTWTHTGPQVDLPMRGAMEASVAELPDGELVMSLRTQLGSVFISRSRDRGEHWSPPQTSGLKAPESCTCLRTVPGTGDLVLFWNDADYRPDRHHYGRRTPLSAARSRDGGRSFVRLGNLAADPGREYTDLSCTFLRNGRAVVTYMKTDDPDPKAFSRSRIDLMAALVAPEFFLG